MIEVTKYSDFEGNVGKTMKIIAKLSKAIWQHFTAFIDSHPYMN